MQIQSFLRIAMSWSLAICVSVAVPKTMHKMTHPGGPDTIGADERQTRYPAVDLETLCKGSKNPKCEAIVDHFCDKSCVANLCAKHGSIRSMCRLLCEEEDLMPQCAKMGPSKIETKIPLNIPATPQLYIPLSPIEQPYPNGQINTFMQPYPNQQPIPLQ
jgi:hypothetical protein